MGVMAAPRPVHESVRRRSEAPLYPDAVRLPAQHPSVAANPSTSLRLTWHPSREPRARLVVVSG